jgi:hypothetical protein
VEDDVPEPIAAKKRAMLKKHSFDEFFAKHSDKNAKPYEFRERYHENVIVTHPKFGKGFVSEVVSDSKVEITFKDSRRVLVHNRKDMPGLPLAAEGDGMATNSKSAKAAKAAAAKAAKEAPKPAPKNNVAVAPAKTAPNRAKVPPAKTSPAVKAGAPKRSAKPAPAVRPVAAKVAKKVAAPKPAKAKPAKAEKKKAKGKK